MSAKPTAGELTIGFLPLVDACLPILAREHGFAEAEGVALRLVRDMSWATVLDRLLYGHSDAAHLVAPLAIATTLGRGRPAVPFVLGLTAMQSPCATIWSTGSVRRAVWASPRRSGRRCV